MSSYGAAELHGGAFSSKYQRGDSIPETNPRTTSVFFKTVVGAVLLLSGTFAVFKSDALFTSSSELMPADNLKSTPSAEITEVNCGFNPTMVLACEVQVASENDVTVFLEYQPNMKGGIRIRTPDVSVSQRATIQIFRLRPTTTYDMHLYVVLKGGERIQSGTTSFVSAETGYPLFDQGSINEIEGEQGTPLLMFALHTIGWRGVVATDQEGFVTWYYNSSVHYMSSHIEAVEQSRNNDYKFCVNDQGYQGDGKSVRIIDALGNTLSWTNNSEIQGHECRITNDKKVLLTSIGTGYLRDHKIVEDFRLNASYHVSEYTTEYLDVWDPYNDEKIPSLQVNLNRFLDWKVIYGFYNAATTGRQGEFQWEDLYLEYSNIHNFTKSYDQWNLRYIHPSSISVSEDGKIYVISFRDTHAVLGIDRDTHQKKFMLSSVIPSVSTHLFENDFEKFYAPHDVSYHENNTLCMMDDGVRRPQGGCTDDDVSTCFSRAVCYYLDDEEKKASLLWEFEYPDENTAGKFNKTMMSEDVFNLNGGSLRKWGEKKWVVAFTSIMYDKPFNHSAWVFDIHETEKGLIEIDSIVRLPKSQNWATSQGTSGSYRATPLESINGEYSVNGGYA